MRRLRELGRAGLADLIGRCCRHAHDIVTRIGALPNARAICVPQINQGLVRFHDARPGATEEDHDKRTDEVMAAINATGEAFFTGTHLAGQTLHAGVGVQLAYHGSTMSTVRWRRRNGHSRTERIGDYPVARKDGKLKRSIYEDRLAELHLRAGENAVLDQGDRPETRPPLRGA